MTITDKLRLELWLREQIKQHGDEFYTELARILERIDDENCVDSRGKLGANFSLRIR